ncbi:hypothetical protein DUK53_09770 [Listeria sp. SHR_NRA_18]|nr:hypothetical protein EP56_17320 [Listeriaceae bacterium FSL A5-0209]RQW66904.1 hypothetical protein DUK53_09770 [Listeria sp. SHR_NRA_18]
MKKISKIFVLLLVFVISFANINWSTENANAAPAKTYENLYNEAKKHLGKSYTWGGNGPNTFDCSGYTKYVFQNGIGVSIPRTSGGQYSASTKISRSQAKQGDLVFFDYGSGIAHVGIYIGNNQMINAQDNGVMIDNLNNSFWSRYIVGFGRMTNLEEPSKGKETLYAKNDLYILKSGNWNSGTAFTLAKGSAAVIDFDRTQNGFVHVKSGTQEGWYSGAMDPYWSETKIVNDKKGKKWLYAKNDLYILKSGSWSSGSSFTLKKYYAALVDFDRTQNGFVHVQVGDQEGWYSGAIDPYWYEEKPNTESKGKMTLYAKNDLYILKYGDWNSQSAFTLKANTPAVVDFDRTQNGFVHVKSGTQEGWYSGAMDSYWSETKLANEEKGKKWLYAKNDLFILKSGNWTSDSSFTLKKYYAALVDFDRTQNGFVHVQVGDQEGWYSGAIDPYWYEEKPNVRTLYAKNDLYILKSGDWNSQVAFTLKANTPAVVDFERTQNGFVYVKSGNQEGWYSGAIDPYWLTENPNVNLKGKKTLYAKSDLYILKSGNWDSGLSFTLKAYYAAIVDFDRTQNGFVHVQAGNQEGWYSGAIDPYWYTVSPNAAYICMKDVIFRDAPQWGTGQAGSRKQGEQVNVVGKENGWLKVSLSGDIGYLPDDGQHLQKK